MRTTAEQHLFIHRQIKRKRQHNRKPQLSIARLRHIVCQYHGITTEELISPCRKRSMVYPRHQFVYLSLRYFPSQTLKQIGSMIGNRDHTTIIHSRNSWQDLLDTDKEIRKDHQKLVEQINNIAS